MYVTAVEMKYFLKYFYFLFEIFCPTLPSICANSAITLVVTSGVITS